MNLSLSNKNPFSTFDFLGYFFPGALFVGVFYILTDYLSLRRDLLPPLFIEIQVYVATHKGMGVFLLILLCYVLGHLLSYVSSVTIELFYTWCYGYPTKYLLRVKSTQNEKRRGGERQHIFVSDLGWRGKCGHLLICLLLLPVTIGHFLIERLFGLSGFLEKELPKDIAESVKLKVNNLFQKLGISIPSDYSRTDVHRVVMHYVYEHCPMHQVKFDNYVALYGFLRSVTFTFNLFFLWQLVKIYVNVEHLWSSTWGFIMMILMIVFVVFFMFLLLLTGHQLKECLSEKCNQKIQTIGEWILGIMVIMSVAIVFMTSGFSKEHLQLLFLFIATYISYLGFAKFYRRFTLENFMALLVYEVPTGDKKNN